MAFPNVFVSAVAAVMYRNLGLSTTDVMLYTSQLYLPWVLKPIWAPLMEAVWRKDGWVVSMQMVISFAFVLVAMLLPVDNSIAITLAVFWVVSFASATQDIAIDGIFMSATSASEQIRYSGVQNLFWNVGAVLSSGGLIYLSGALHDQYKLSWTFCWMIVLIVCSAYMAFSAVWHAKALPDPGAVSNHDFKAEALLSSLWNSWVSFFAKKSIWAMIGVVFFYRFAEGFLEKLAPIFLLDSREVGGLGLSNQMLGLVNGSLGTIGFVTGTIVAGLLVAKLSLRKSFFLLALALNVPHFSYYFLSNSLPTDLMMISVAVILEKIGYGMGSVGHMLYMVQQVSPGRFQMSHYAFATGIMALCKWLTGLLSGPLFALLQYDYSSFFLAVLLISIVPILVSFCAPFYAYNAAT